MKQALTWSLAPLLLAAAAACSGPGVENGALSGLARYVGDDAVRKRIELRNERVAFSDNGFAVYQVELVNRDDDDVRAEFRPRWFDDRGLEVDDVTRTWRPVFIPAGSSYPARSTAPNMEAVRCVIEVRVHDPVTG